MATDRTAQDDILPWERTPLPPAVSPSGTVPPPAAGAGVPLPPAIAVGMPKISGFALHEEIGRGGMGIVYRATQKGLNRTVALKMVVGAADGSNTAERFLVEAEAVASVRHPQVVQVYEYGNLGGIPFLAMEYLPGGSLSDALTQRGRFLSSDATTMIGELASAVGAAHAQGIVHRDLKPGNVLFSDAGVPKVTDFGLAKRSNQDLTKTGMVFGTPSYMAPEQAKGEAKRVGPPADVWALGVMLYELLTGTLPFRGDRMETILWSVVYEPPQPPRQVVPGVPLDLELICLKCLSKDPAKRYPTATALASELECYAAGEPISVREAGRVERFAGWTRKRSSLAAGIALTTVAAMLAVFGGLQLARQRAFAEKDRETAEARRAADEMSEVAEARRRVMAEREERDKADADVRAYPELVRRAGRELRFGNVAAAGRSLAACPVAARGWEWHEVANRLPPPPVAVPFPRAAAVAVSAKSAAAISADGKVVVFDPATGDRKWERAAADGGAAIDLRFTPDGTRLTTVQADRVTVWDVATGGEMGRRDRPKAGGWRVVLADSLPRVLTHAAGELLGWDVSIPKPLTAPAWTMKGVTAVETRSAIGKHAAYIGRDGRVSTVDVRSWTAKGQSFKAPPESAFWTDEPSRRLVLVLRDRTVYAHPLDSPDESPRVVADAPVVCVAVRPDGKRLAVVTADGAARVADLGGPSPALGPKLPADGAVMYAAYLPDGRLFTATNTGDFRVQAATGAAVRIDGPANLVPGDWTGPAYRMPALDEQWFGTDSPAALLTADGGHVVTLTDRLRVWRTADGTECPYQPEAVGRVGSLAVGPGRVVVGGAANAGVRVWSLPAPPAFDADTGFKGHAPDVYLPAKGISFAGKATPELVRRTANGDCVVFADESAVRFQPVGAGRGLTLGHAFTLADGLAHGERFAVFCRHAGVLRLIRRPNASVPVPDPHPYGAGVTAAGFSPDGTRLATAAADEVIVRDTDTGAVVVRLSLPANVTASAVAFDANHSRLAVADGVRPTVRRTEVDAVVSAPRVEQVDGKLRMTAGPTRKPVVQYRLAADPPTVPAAPRLLVYDLRTGQLAWDDAPTVAPEWVAFDPTGRYLLAGRTGRPTAVYDGSAKSPGSAVAPATGVP